jgi:hypothetical protein
MFLQVRGNISVGEIWGDKTGPPMFMEIHGNPKKIDDVLVLQLPPHSYFSENPLIIRCLGYKSWIEELESYLYRGIIN